jgi:hypothetical protein
MDYDEAMRILREAMRSNEDLQARHEEHELDWDAIDAKCKAQPPSPERDQMESLLSQARANYIASQRQFETEQSLMVVMSLVAQIGEAVGDLRTRVAALEGTG